MDKHPGLVAKIYHKHKPPTASTQAKIRWMIQHPPRGAGDQAGHTPLAWPIDLVLDGKAIVGYLMPLVDLTHTIDLYRVIDPVFRARFQRADQNQFTWRNLHQIAANLAHIVASCHDERYVVGDLNNKNTFVHRTGQVTLIDNDSFQVTTDRETHRCGVIREDFTPPELIGFDLRTVDRYQYHDNHILAILIFMLLQDSRHPFLGVCAGESDPVTPLEMSRRRWYPYDITRGNAKVAPHHLTPPMARLHPELVRLFQACFVDGLQIPASRPLASEWTTALLTAAGSIKRCTRGHEYSDYPGAICMTKYPGGYCGCTVTHRGTRPVPIASIDGLTGASVPRTGAVTTSPNIQVLLPVQPAGVQSHVSLELTLSTSNGAHIPDGTIVDLYRGVAATGSKLRSRTISPAKPSGHHMQFRKLPAGSYVLVVQQASGYNNLRFPFALGATQAARIAPTLQAAVRPLIMVAFQVAINTSNKRPLPVGTPFTVATDTGQLIEAGNLTSSLASGGALPLKPLPAGHYTLSIILSGYQPLQHRFLADQGHDRAVITLQEIVAIPKHFVRLDIEGGAGHRLSPNSSVSLEIEDNSGKSEFRETLVVAPSGTVEQFLYLPSGSYTAIAGAAGYHSLRYPFTVSSSQKRFTLHFLPVGASPSAPPPTAVTLYVDPPAGQTLPAGGTYTISDVRKKVIDSGSISPNRMFQFVSAPGTYTVNLVVPGLPPRSLRKRLEFTSAETMRIQLTSPPAGRSHVRTAIFLTVVSLVLLQVVYGLPLNMVRGALGLLGDDVGRGPIGLEPRVSIGEADDPAINSESLTGLTGTSDIEVKPVFAGATGYLVTGWQELTGDSSLIVYNMATSERTREISADASTHRIHSPALSSDGAMLAFVADQFSDPRKQGLSEIVIMPVVVPEFELPHWEILTRFPSGSTVTNLTWDAADAALVVSVADAVGSYILSVSRATERVELFTPAESSNPAFSMDGQFAAYVVPEAETTNIVFGNASGQAQIYVADSPLHHEDNPTFSPDGSKIAYDRQDIESNEHETVVWDADSTIYMVTQGISSSATNPIWSPDGRFLAVMRSHDSSRYVAIIETDTYTTVAEFDAAFIVAWSWAGNVGR